MKLGGLCKKSTLGVSISNPIALPESWESEPEESPETQRPVSWVCTVEKYQAQTAKSLCFKVEGKEQHRGCFLPSTCVVGTPVCSVLLSHAPSLLCLSLSVSLFLSLCLCYTHTHTQISQPLLPVHGMERLQPVLISSFSGQPYPTQLRSLTTQN